MKVSVSKSAISGKVATPSSKSYTIRGLMCAALANGRSEIVRPLSSDDTVAAGDVLRRIGVTIKEDKDSWRVTGDKFHAPSSDLFCGDSAATLRFMMAICALVPGKCHLTAGPSLSRRPVGPLAEALGQLGVGCSTRDGLPPADVAGGKLKGGTTALPGDISSQFVSALLLVAPLAEGNVTIKLTTPLESIPYVRMTLECLERFGISVKASPDLKLFEIVPQQYRPAKYEVEGDWSSASYFLALGATSGEVEVTNLNPESLQGDRVLLDFLREMGASVKIDRNSVIMGKSRLKALRADLTDCTDLLPTVAVLAAVAEGTSELTGITRARLKESDRVAAVRDGLEKMGIDVREEENKLSITGVAKPRGAVIDTRADHRMAMAFSILGSVAGDTIIEDAACVSKTYPGFWQCLESIGGRVKYEQ
ncbi:MAG: 3-phosphoshikimate 1-carboxyvinyltransferase [Chloroflexi bacterium]|nr:3-phosphoshikimate 1-carboxyvinyltransferase [Chloroflexota bacterium]